MAYSPFRDFSLKVLAVGIAVLLWLSVAGERVIEGPVRRVHDALVQR